MNWYHKLIIQQKMYNNNYKISILPPLLTTYLTFTIYWCLLYYAYIPYGNIQLNDNKICNITGSEVIEYDFGKYIKVLNINIIDEPILGRAYITDDMGTKILGKFEGKYVYERNAIFNNMPAWFCNSACNDYDFNMNCFQNNYVCDENNYYECYVGTELSNGVYPVILKQTCDDCNPKTNFAPHGGAIFVEVFFPIIMISSISFLISESILAQRLKYEINRLIIFESSILFKIRSFLHFVALFLVAIFVLARRLSVEMFSGNLKIELFGILFFVCFPYGMFEICRNIGLSVKAGLYNSQWGLFDLIFPGNHVALKIEFNVKIFTCIITVYVPIICLMSLLWFKYEIDNFGEIIAFALLILQVLLQLSCDLYRLCGAYFLKESILENSLNSHYTTDEKVYASE